MNKKNQRYECTLCGQCLKTKTTLTYHLYGHDSTTASASFICNFEECGKAFRNPKRLSDHKRRYHLKTENYICEYCGYQTAIKCNLVVHQRKHTGDRPYCCVVCALGFPSSYQLSLHRETHAALRKYPCTECEEYFGDRKTLYHHRALHNVKANYNCKLCHDTFVQSAALSKHMKWHREQMQRYTLAINIIN